MQGGSQIVYLAVFFMTCHRNDEKTIYKVTHLKAVERLKRRPFPVLYNITVRIRMEPKDIRFDCNAFYDVLNSD